MTYTLHLNPDGTTDLIAPDGTTVKSYTGRPVESVITAAVMDNLGVTDSGVREAIKYAVSGVEVVNNR